MSDADPIAEFPLRIGRLSRPHGLQGALHLQVFRTRPLRAHDIKPHKVAIDVELEWPDGKTERHRVVSVKWQGPAQAVLRFADIGDRTAADRCVGAFLDVDPQKTPDALIDEVDTTLGAEVIDKKLGSLGTVVALRDNGAQALLVIEAPHEILVPFVSPLISAVSTRDGRTVVEVELPDGLVELNQSGT